MIAPYSRNIGVSFRLEQYTHAWALGTGVPVSLPPGHYHVTGETETAGVRYFEVNRRYRVDSRKISASLKPRRATLLSLSGR